jgi:WD40 repeat protein
MLASAGANNLLRMWSMSHFNELIALRRHIDQCDSIAYSFDGRIVACGSSLRALPEHLTGGSSESEECDWDEETGELTVNGLQETNTAAGTVVAADDAITRGSTSIHSRATTVPRNTSTDYLVMAPDGSSFATYTRNRNSISIWHPSLRQVIRTLPCINPRSPSKQMTVTSMCYSTDNTRLAAGTKEGYLFIF